MKKSKFIFILINLQLLSFIGSCLILKFYELQTIGVAFKWRFVEPSLATLVFIIFTIGFCYLLFLALGICIRESKNSRERFNINLNPFVILFLILLYLFLVSLFGHSFRSNSNMLGKMIIAPLQTFITIYLLLLVLSFKVRKLYNNILILAFALGASGVGHLSVCIGLIFLNFFTANRSRYKYILLTTLTVLCIPALILYLMNIKYAGTYTGDLDTAKYLAGWIVQRLSVQPGLAVYLIESSYQGVQFLNGLQVQLGSLGANVCKLFGCLAETDFKSVNQYAFSIFYRENFTASSPGASPLTFGSSILLVNFWLGPLVAALLINFLSYIMSGWHVFFEKDDYIRIIILYTFILKFLFFSPIVLINVIDPYFVRVVFFAAAPFFFKKVQLSSNK